MATATRTIVRYRRPPKARRRSTTGKRIPLAVVAGFVPLAMFAYEGYLNQGILGAVRWPAQRLTGWDDSVKRFMWPELVKGWGPIVGGIVAHKIASKLGINRAIARAGIPWLSI